MRAVIGQKFGILSKNHRQQLPEPQLGPQQVRIRIHYAAQGHAEGRYQFRPLPLLFLAVNLPASLTPSATKPRAGTHVSVTAQGLGRGLAEFAVVPASAVSASTQNVDDAACAVFGVDFSTALHALRGRASLRPGESLLVFGAEGNLGLAAIQIAHLLGCHVIAAASSEPKRLAALAAGAHDVLDYSLTGWGEQLKILIQNRGVDVVFDSAGVPALRQPFVA